MIQRADEVVARDPFWSVVRRRHPEVDIVVLPPPVPGEQATPEGAPTEEPDRVAAREDAEVRRLWVRLVGDLGPLETSWEARWVSGGAADRVRREATLSVHGVAETFAEALPGIAARLRDQGWHVQAPGTGFPRVLAGRDAVADPAGVEWAGRSELQLVLVPERSRLVLRARSLDHVVGRDQAHLLVVGS